jgi:hypothetical protein
MKWREVIDAYEFDRSPITTGYPVLRTGTTRSIS